MISPFDCACDANWAARGALQETTGLIVQIYTTENDLSSFDKTASSLFFCAPVDLELMRAAVCALLLGSLIASTLFDMFPSACWDGPCWHPYRGIISVCPPWHAGAAWTRLVSSSFHTSSPLLWSTSLGLGCSSTPSHHVLRLLLLIPDSDLLISDPACQHQADTAVN